MTLSTKQLSIRHFLLQTEEIRRRAAPNVMESEF